MFNLEISLNFDKAGFQVGVASSVVPAYVKEVS
jgi:hypothetical protein